MAITRKITSIDIANKEEINDIDLETIADQIKRGFSSGRLDDGEGKHISWSLETEVWVEDIYEQDTEQR